MINNNCEKSYQMNLSLKRSISLKHSRGDLQSPRELKLSYLKAGIPVISIPVINK